MNLIHIKYPYPCFTQNKGRKQVMTTSLLSWHKILSIISIAIHVHPWTDSNTFSSCLLPSSFLLKTFLKLSRYFLFLLGESLHHLFVFFHQVFPSWCTSHTSPSFRELLNHSPLSFFWTDAAPGHHDSKVYPSVGLKEELTLFTYCIHSASGHELPLQSVILFKAHWFR